MRESKAVDPDGRARSEDLRGSKERENHNQDIIDEKRI